MNDPNKSDKFKVGQHVGNAEAVVMLSNHLDSDFAINRVSDELRTPPNQTLLVHLEQLFDRSSEELYNEESQMLCQLLKDYSDIFFIDEMDQGWFTGIQHYKDTGNANPVKQKFRRTLLGFQDKEKSIYKNF